MYMDLGIVIYLSALSAMHPAVMKVDKYPTSKLDAMCLAPSYALSQFDGYRDNRMGCAVVSSFYPVSYGSRCAMCHSYTIMIFQFVFACFGCYDMQ